METVRIILAGIRDLIVAGRDYLIPGLIVTALAILAIACPWNSDPDLNDIRVGVVLTAIAYDLLLFAVFGLLGFLLLCSLPCCNKAR